MSDYIGKEPKVYKKCSIIDTRHEPKGEQAHNQTNQGPDKKGDKAKTK
jgi:hypothetical protein